MNKKQAVRVSLSKLLHTNRLAMLIELILISAPVILGLVVSDALDTHTIPLTNDVTLIGSWYMYGGLMLSLVLLWVVYRLRDARLNNIGLRKPENWLIAILQSLGVSLAVLLAVKAVIEPIIRLLPGTLERDMSRFEVLEGNLPNLLIQLLVVWVTAGFLEEFLFRGYLTHRFIDILEKDTKFTWILASVASAFIFGLAHAYQGPLGVFRTGAIGLVYGLAYLTVGRNLWPLILSHAMIDSIDMISHYFGG